MLHTPALSQCMVSGVGRPLLKPLCGLSSCHIKPLCTLGICPLLWANERKRVRGSFGPPGPLLGWESAPPLPWKVGGGGGSESQWGWVSHWDQDWILEKVTPAWSYELKGLVSSPALGLLRLFLALGSLWSCYKSRQQEWGHRWGWAGHGALLGSPWLDCLGRDLSPVYAVHSGWRRRTQARKATHSAFPSPTLRPCLFRFPWPGRWGDLQSSGGQSKHQDLNSTTCSARRPWWWSNG